MMQKYLLNQSMSKPNPNSSTYGRRLINRAKPQKNSGRSRKIYELYHYIIASLVNWFPFGVDLRYNSDNYGH